MSRSRFSRAVLLLIAAILVLGIAGCGATQPATPPTDAEQPATESPDAGARDGEALVQTKCTMCHTLDRVNQATYDAAKWAETVDRMQQNGLVITDEEKQLIVEYLAGR